MKLDLRAALGVVLALATACGGRGGHEDAHEHAHQENDEPEAHAEPAGAEQVTLTEEAAALAEIRVGAVERRALAGRGLIPAEVAFEPTSTAHVGPLVSGRITQVAVALGDRVKRGQLLGTVASSDVSSARARLAQSRARLAAAESTLQRQRQLSTEGIGAQRALVEAEAEVSQLRAEVEGLRTQLAVFGSGGSGELRLTAPIEGVVVDVHATLGETATPEAPAFIVTDPTKVSVLGYVPELELSRVLAGSQVIVRLHAFPELAMLGTIRYVAPALDERTRSLPIRVALAAPDPRLRSGLFGTIELVGGDGDERVLVVPTGAIATLAGQDSVFVPVPGGEAGRLAFRPAPVVLGRRAGGYVEIKAGIAEGAPIAASGAFTLKSALQSGALTDGHGH